MTNRTIQDVRYGSDDSGRVYKAYPDPLDPTYTVVEVMYECERPKWDRYTITDEQGMNTLSYEKQIFWLDSVIEV